MKESKATELILPVDPQMLAYYRLTEAAWQQLSSDRQDRLKGHFLDWKWRQGLKKRHEKLKEGKP